MENDNLVIKSKKHKGDDGYRIFSVRLKEDLVTQIDDIAANTGYSRNELIRIFLEYAISHCEIESSND